MNMKKVLNFSLVLLVFLFVSCSEEMDVSMIDASIENPKSINNINRMAIIVGLGVGKDPNCPPGAGGCALPSIPTDWGELEDAVAYVGIRASHQVVSGIEILNRKTIKYHLLYQGQDYPNAGLEPGGLFHVIEGGVLLSELSADRLGVRSITLLEGEYRIQNSNKRVWSGYVDIKASIK